jgi:hypothetical protein
LNQANAANLISGRLTVLGPNGHLAHQEQGKWGAMVWAPPAGARSGWYTWEAVFVVPTTRPQPGEGSGRKAIQRSGRLYIEGGQIVIENPNSVEDGGKETDPAAEEVVEEHDSLSRMLPRSGAAVHGNEPAAHEAGLLGRAIGSMVDFVFPSAHAADETVTGDLTIEDGVPQIFFNDTDTAGTEWGVRGNSNRFTIGPDASTISGAFEIDDEATDGSLGIPAGGGVCASSGGVCGPGPDQGGTDVSIRSNQPALEWIDTDDAEDQKWGIFTNGDLWRVLDRTGGNASVFTAEAGAVNNAIYVSDNPDGGIGFGTAVPGAHIHVRDTNQPDLRLDDGTDIWELELSPGGLFTIDDDGTGDAGSPFQIQKGATADALVIASTGNIGLGTSSPNSKLHLRATDGSSKILLEETQAIATNLMLTMRHNGNPGFQLENTDQGNTWQFRLGGSGGSEQFTVNKLGTGTPEASFVANGNLVIAGSLIEGSSRKMKQDIAPVDTSDLMKRLDALDVHEWSYTRSPENRHIGPMAEDFYQIFGFGKDEKSIFPRDLAGIALAAAKEVHRRNQALEAQNAELMDRLDSIEARLEQAY